MARWLIGWAAAAVALAAGCKKQTPAALPRDTVPQTAPTPKEPTSQALRSGPRTQVKLGPLPLAADVPAGWSISQPPGTGITFLEGPLPSGGEAHIQLTSKPAIWTDSQSPVSMDERVKLLEEGAQKEQKDHPNTIKRVEVRDLDGVKILEKESVFQPPAGQVLDPQGRPVVVPEQHRWTITVFIPQGKAFQTYELNFLSLSQADYEANKAFLSGIIDSLKLEK